MIRNLLLVNTISNAVQSKDAVALMLNEINTIACGDVDLWVPHSRRRKAMDANGQLHGGLIPIQESCILLLSLATANLPSYFIRKSCLNKVSVHTVFCCYFRPTWSYVNCLLNLDVRVESDHKSLRRIGQLSQKLKWWASKQHGLHCTRLTPGALSIPSNSLIF
jgi:hypothetical protein